MKKLRNIELANVVKGSLIHDQEVTIDHICIDNRICTKSSMFVAIIGQNNDGHIFIKKAIEAGARLIMIEKELEEYDPSVSYIKVASTVKALGQMAKYYLSLHEAKIIGITGSAGKTTVKNILAGVLASKYCVSSTLGNYNNDIGVPLSIFAIDERSEFIVLELGMNNLGEIHYLSHIIEPDIAVITNIGSAHIGNLGSKENIYKAKMEIVDYLKKDGLLIVNGDDSFLKDLAIQQKVIKVGFNEGNTYRVKNFKDLGIHGIEGDVDFEDKSLMHLKMDIPGYHMCYSAMIAMAVGGIFGIEEEAISEFLSTFTNTKMRMEKKVYDNNRLLINDAYNANPESMKVAIDVLEKTEYKNKIAIIGDMLELGHKSREAHGDIGSYMINKDIQYVFCYGDETKATYDVLLKEKNMNQLNMVVEYFPYDKMDQLKEGVEAVFTQDAALLLKGSRGMKLERIIQS